MLPKRIFALILTATLAVTQAGALRAQWVQTNGPYGGPITSFASSGTNLFVGTSHGVFLSSTNGSSWIPDGLSNYRISSLASSGMNLFAGTSDGVFRSTDDGISWTQQNAGLTQHNVSCLAILGSIVFAGTDTGVFRSIDNGMNWSFAGLETSIITSLATFGTNLFCGTRSHSPPYSSSGIVEIFRSTDSGASWVSANKGLPYDLSLVNSLGISGTNLFAGYGTDGVFLSTNNGLNWTAENVGLPRDPSNYYPQVTSFAVLGTSLFAGTSEGVFRSNDKGTTWTGVGIGRYSVEALFASGSSLFAGTLGGVFLTTNGGASWTESNNGLTNYSSVSALALSGKNLFAGTPGGGVFLSTNGGANWTDVNTGLQNYIVDCFATSGINIFAGTDLGAFRSTNSGASWTPINTGLIDTTVISPATILSLAVSDTNLFAGGYDRGVFRSSDNGTSWTNIGLTYPVNTFTVSDSIILVGGGRGNVFRSIDKGMNWVAIDSAASLGFYILSSAILGSDLFVATEKGLFRSLDNGISWKRQTGIPPNTNIDAMIVSGTAIFVGTYWNGLFLSTDSGTAWVNVNSGFLPKNVPISSLAIVGSDLFAGTWNNAGVWRRPLSEMIGQSAVQPKPAINTEIRSFPNPFSQSTTITFVPGTSGYAEVSIVNLLGEEVAHLFSGELAAGEHNFRWSKPTGLPDGAYKCLIRMNGRIETLPMLLLR